MRMEHYWQVLWHRPGFCMNICLLDNSKTPYNHNSLDNENIRGAERSLINLALKLNKLGHKITILNNNVEKINYENIRYININSYNEKINYDLAVSNNDINNFNYVKAKKKIAISHSIQTIEKFIRKRQLFAYLRHKPKIFLLGQYHKNKRNLQIKFRHQSYFAGYVIHTP